MFENTVGSDCAANSLQKRVKEYDNIVIEDERIQAEEQELAGYIDNIIVRCEGNVSDDVIWSLKQLMDFILKHRATVVGILAMNADQKERNFFDLALTCGRIYNEIRKAQGACDKKI